MYCLALMHINAYRNLSHIHTIHYNTYTLYYIIYTYIIIPYYIIPYIGHPWSEPPAPEHVLTRVPARHEPRRTTGSV